MRYSGSLWVSVEWFLLSNTLYLGSTFIDIISCSLYDCPVRNVSPVLQVSKLIPGETYLLALAGAADGVSDSHRARGLSFDAARLCGWRRATCSLCVQFCWDFLEGLRLHSRHDSDVSLQPWCPAHSPGVFHSMHMCLFVLMEPTCCYMESLESQDDKKKERLLPHVFCIIFKSTISFYPKPK